MAWFIGNPDSPFQSHSFVGDSTRREESISQSIDSIQQTIRALQANLGIQDKNPVGHECHGPFHHPYHEPYHQPPFQPTHSPYPPYRSYHEPSPPPYNPYYEPSHNPPPYNRMPYHEPSHLPSHPTSRPCHPSHEFLNPFEPPSEPHSQPCVPNRKPTIREVLAKLQNQVNQTVDEKRSQKANFDHQMDSIMRRMEHQEKENERMEKEIERLTQQSQVLKTNFQENPLPMFTHTKEVEQLEDNSEKLEKAMEWPTQESSMCHNLQETGPPHTLPYEQPIPPCPEHQSQPSTPQPSGLDAFLTLPYMDAQTLTLRRMYDQLKVRHQFLFNLKEALPRGFSEEMEEEMEGIEKFIKDFVHHVLWIKTEGEEGAPWSCTSNDDGKTEEQHLNATSQVEISNPSVPLPTQAQEVKQVQKNIEESSLPFGNAPILIEVYSSTTLTNEAIHDLSDDEVDEEIIVESPQMFENVIAQTVSSSSSDSIVLVDDCALTSLCDASTVEDASLHSTRDVCDELTEVFSCSCAEYRICVDCYHEKCHLLVEFQKKAFSGVVDSTIDHNTLSCTIDDSKHDNCEQVESCMNDNVVDLSEKDHSLECQMHKIPIELLPCSLVGDKDSEIVIDKILHVGESFQQVLSCDLPPDLEKKNNCFESLKSPGGNNLKNSLSSSTLLTSISCDCNDDVVCPNTKLDSAPSLLQTQENFHNITGCLTPTDRSVIDFLGCDSYLESLELNMSLIHLKLLHVSIFGRDTAICSSSLQAHHWKGPLCNQHPPYILGPLPIDPEPPPPRKFSAGEDVVKDKCLILIRDENFSFKRLKIL